MEICTFYIPFIVANKQAQNFTEPDKITVIKCKRMYQTQWLLPSHILRSFRLT
jgi:hypothetical protein